MFHYNTADSTPAIKAATDLPDENARLIASIIEIRCRRPHSTPMAEEEISTIRQRMGVEEPTYEVDLTPGETVNIVDGPFKDFDGQVDEVDKAKGKIKVLVNMFGRETPVELDLLQVEKVH